MAGKEFQFNAPTFLDFTKDNFDEVDESYFDLPRKTPRRKTPRRKTQGQQDLKVAEEREQPPTEQGEKQEQPLIEQGGKEQPLTEKGEKQEQGGKEEQPLTEQEEKQEQGGKEEQLPTEQGEKQEQQPKEQGEKQKQGGKEEQPLAEQGEKQEQPPTQQGGEQEQVPTEEEPEPITEKAEQGEMPTKRIEEQENITEQAEQDKMPTEQAEEQGKTTPEKQEELTEQAEQKAIEQGEQAEESMATEEVEQEDPPAEPPKSISRDKKRSKSLRLEGAGVRQSPRLLAISKALRRSNARRLSGDFQAATSAQAKQGKKVQTQKRAVAKVSSISITEGDKEDLELVATFRQKITINKKRKDSTAPNQPLKTTKPQEFHFATDKRLRKQEVEDPAPLPPPPAARSTRSGPTKPQEFTFATDKRIKSKESVKEEAEEPIEFARSLRSSTLSLNKESAGRRTPTNPKPFHLSAYHKEQGEAAKRFLSMADLSCKNYIRTPDVVRNKRTTSTDDLDNRKKPRGPTVAVTPKLATSRRRRSLSLMTREEREQQEFEEAQKHAFKARPVNKKALRTPPNGYKVPTKPQDRPSESLLEDMIKIDSPPKMLVSMLPYAGLSMQGKKSNTKLKPFSFDKRDQERLKKKEEKIKKVLEDEKSLAEFHARPMPLFEGIGVLPRKPPTPTQVKPFALNVERRGSIKQERFKQQLEDEAKKDAEQRKFHAQDDSVVHKNPFVPKKPNRPLVEISNVTLSTEVRAVERSKFDMQQKELEEEMLAAKKMAEEQRAVEEQEELTRVREAAVHKAQPMPKTKPMVLQPTAQMPTVPISPDFATDSRLRARSRANSTFNL